VTIVAFSTKDRLLNSAEQLFAEHGFASTSLRQLTTLADVNIAAVNYHFGSKDNLINEVFRRRLDDLSERRMKALQQAQSLPENTLEKVLAAFIRPALEISIEHEGGSAFVRMLARAYA